MKRIFKTMVSMVIMLILAPFAIIVICLISVFSGEGLPNAFLKVDRFLRVKADETRRE